MRSTPGLQKSVGKFTPKFSSNERDSSFINLTTSHKMAQKSQDCK